MRKLFVILGIIFVVVSCEQLKFNEYYRLPDKYSTELRAMDMLIFENEEGYRDSLVVKNIVFGENVIALSGTSGKEPYAYHEFEYIMINNIRDNYDDIWCYNSLIGMNDGPYGEGGYLSFFNSCDSLIIGVLIGLKNDWEATFDDEPKDYSLEINWYNQRDFVFEQNHESMLVGNSIYTDVQEYSSYSQIKTIFYDYESGIIKYIDSENYTWERID